MAKTRSAANGGKLKRGGRNGCQPVYTRAIEDQIFNKLAAGEGLATICKDSNMPSEQAVRLWVMDDRPPGIASRYARARTIGYHHLADEILELSDDTSFIDRPDVASAMVAQQRLAVDSRKWLLAKALPKIYGEKIELTGDNDAPLVTEIQLVPVKPRVIGNSALVIEHDADEK